MTGADVRGLDKTLGIPLIWGRGLAAHPVVVMFTDSRNAGQLANSATRCRRRSKRKERG
jgi:hypothetical protein